MLMIVNLFLTFECNLKCKFCYLRKYERKVKEIGLRKITNFLENFNYSKLFILGGEPFLRIRKLEKVISSLKVTGISTNGTIYSKKISRKIASKKVKLQVSLDAGSEETYRKIKRGDLKKVIKNIKRFLRDGNDATLSYVIFKDNYNEIDKFIELSRDLGVKVNFSYFIPVRKKDKELLLAIYEMRKVFGRLRRKGFKVFFRYSNWKSYKLCSASIKKISILPNGKIVGCIFFKYLLGSVEEGIKRLLLVGAKKSLCPAFLKVIGDDIYIRRVGK